MASTDQRTSRATSKRTLSGRLRLVLVALVALGTLVPACTVRPHVYDASCRTPNYGGPRLVVACESFRNNGTHVLDDSGEAVTACASLVNYAPMYGLVLHETTDRRQLCDEAYCDFHVWRYQRAADTAEARREMVARDPCDEFAATGRLLYADDEQPLRSCELRLQLDQLPPLDSATSPTDARERHLQCSMRVCREAWRFRSVWEH